VPGFLADRPYLLEEIDEPPRSDHGGSEGFCPPPQFTIGGDKSHLISLVREGLDERVVTATRSVKDRDAITDPGRDTLTSLAFKNDDDGRGDLPGGNRRLHLLDEEPGCPSSVPPPASRTRPDHVRGVNQKHFRSLAAQRRSASSGHQLSAGVLRTLDGLWTLAT
jgi:hypothetical protein